MDPTGQKNLENHRHLSLKKKKRGMSHSLSSMKGAKFNRTKRGTSHQADHRGKENRPTCLSELKKEEELYLWRKVQPKGGL